MTILSRLAVASCCTPARGWADDIRSSAGPRAGGGWGAGAPKLIIGDPRAPQRRLARVLCQQLVRQRPCAPYPGTTTPLGCPHLSPNVLAAWTRSPDDCLGRAGRENMAGADVRPATTWRFWSSMVTTDRSASKLGQTSASRDQHEAGSARGQQAVYSI
ncbi:MAG: hypothetical protein J3K34DRAFT_405947 [Monoraphidium minutum]|nr:MAG: hypothetical protein J3K34DRAFT_405947 [Monoraphidium minutum]